MGLLTDQIGTIVNCIYRTASSAAAATSNATGIGIKGMSSIVFLCEVLVAATSDGDTSDGAVKIQIQYDSDGSSASGSDAATSNATMSCTDAVYVFSTANAAGDIIVIEVDLEAKGFESATGFLFPSLNGDSVSIMHVCAIPVPGTNQLPYSQTKAAVVASA